MKLELQSEGVVSRVAEGVVYVRIEQKSACSGCHAQGYCASTDCKERELEVRMPSGGFAPGDAVRIYALPSMGRRAVFLSFILPLILLLVVMFVCKADFVGFSDGLSALVSLLVVGVYYLILYFSEPKIRKTMHYTIEKINA